MSALSVISTAATNELSINTDVDSNWKPFLEQIVISTRDIVPLGYWGFQIWVCVSIIVGLCSAAPET